MKIRMLPIYTFFKRLQKNDYFYYPYLHEKYSLKSKVNEITKFLFCNHFDKKRCDKMHIKFMMVFKLKENHEVELSQRWLQ